MFIRIFSLLSSLVAASALMVFSGFLQNWTPKGIDTPFVFRGGGVAMNVVLLLAFGIGHSALARPAVKRMLFGTLNARMSRSVYNLVAGVQLGLLMAFWTPMPGTLWRFDSALGIGLAHAIFLFGWLLLFVATFAIDPWHMFGLRQAFSKQQAEPAFSMRGPYRFVRHPIQAGLILAFWATPHMTAGHALLAAFLTAYSVLATLHLEERDLHDQLGREYASYSKRVPALIPRLFGRRKA